MTITSATARSLVQAVLEKSRIAESAMYSFTLTNNPSVLPEVDVKLTALAAALAAVGYGSGAGPVVTVPSSMDVLGDSKVAYGEPALTTTGGQTSVSPLGIVNDIERLAGRTGFDVLGFFAVGGTTAQQCLSTQVPQSIASPARTALVGTGVNSYNDALVGGAGPYTQAQILTAMQSIIDQLSAAKDYVWVRAIDPVNQSGSTGAKARAGEFQAHNAAVAAMCAAKPNVRFVDSYNVLLDTGSGQLNAKTDTLRADDGIHNTTLGARLIGEGIQGPMMSGVTLTPYRAIGPSLLVGFTGNSTGGTTTAGTGTINGSASIPAGWNVQVISGSAVVTVSRPDADTVRLNVVNATGTASTIYLQYASLSALFAQVTPGTDTIQAGVDFSVLAGAAGLTRVAVTARENGGSPLWNAMARDTTFEPDAVLKYNQAAQTGRRWTHPRTLPGGTTGVEMLIAVNAAATTGNFTVDFKNPTYHKRT